jgi:uncharacterized membrane protein
LVAAALALAASGAEAQTVWRGNFLAGKQGLQMSPCRSGERLAVEDRTPGRELESLYQELAQRAGRAIFIEIGGTREKSRLIAERVHRAHAEGPGCREDLQEIRLRALGSEPFWSLEARADAVLLRRLGVQPPMRFPAGAFERRGSEFVYEGASENSVLHVAVREARCRDTMSGAFFTLGIQLELDGKQLSGCAYWGDLGAR